MAVLGAAEDGAIDGTSCDFHVGITHVVEEIELGTGIALTTTEEVAGDGVVLDLCIGTRHTQGTAAHLHRGRTARHSIQFACNQSVIVSACNSVFTHIGELTAAIH